MMKLARYAGLLLTAACAVVCAQPPPDLTIAKAHVGTSFTQGQSGAYTLTVSNAGPGATTGTITVTDTLPAGLTFASGTGSGWSCSANGQAVTCMTDGVTQI